MLGAVAGDIIGSVYEHRPIKTTRFPLFQDHSHFTDDSVLTLAVAQAILEGKEEYGWTLKEFGRAYPQAGYGGSFYQWIFEQEVKPYNSWGNGAAMRVSPVGFAFHEENRVLQEAQKTAAVSHDHPEGIKGAQAAALTVLLARRGILKSDLRKRIADQFNYDLNRTVEEIRPGYGFDVSCQGTVPEALTAFLDAEGYENAVRLAVSLGGDSDTLACIAGAAAEAFYGGVPATITRKVKEILPGNLWSIIETFYQRFDLPLFL